jgi:hypothetical protein
VISEQWIVISLASATANGIGNTSIGFGTRIGNGQFETLHCPLFTVHWRSHGGMHDNLL